ncbi:hypothetical protein DNTS_005804, partial [Danionella cerebrum]
MSSEWTWSLLFVLGFLVDTGAHGGTVCTVKSSKGKEVLVGSNFTVSCNFNKDCTRQVFWNNAEISYKELPNSNEVFVFVENLTEPSIFTCRCTEDPEPCGIDINPGYPPQVTQNLSCDRKTQFGNVSCTWGAGRNTKILTTCHLRVKDDLHYGFESFMNSTAFCSITFPIKSSLTSELVVFLNVSNSLGSQSSGPHLFNLNDIVKPSVPTISRMVCSSRWCNLHVDKHSVYLHEGRYKAPKEEWKTNGKSGLNISSLQPHTTYRFQIRRKINETVGLWSDWSQEMNEKTEEEAPDKVLNVWYLNDPQPSKPGNCFYIIWKASYLTPELSASDSKGKIKRYNITIQENSTVTKLREVIPPKTNQTVCCSQCSVSVSAENSMGQSPQRFMRLLPPNSVSSLQSYNILNHHSIALFWPKLAIGSNSTEYVVHWHPVGDKGTIQWIKVFDVAANITGKFLDCFQCLLPRVIPDPANSKCAKSYADYEDIKCYLEKCDSNMIQEPDNVEVEEVPHAQTCTYIKSFSFESDSSDDTNNTSSTDITDDYIISHETLSVGGDEGDKNDEELSLDEFKFFPSIHCPFLEPWVSAGGMLTLD